MKSKWKNGFRWFVLIMIMSFVFVGCGKMEKLDQAAMKQEETTKEEQSEQETTVEKQETQKDTEDKKRDEITTEEVLDVSEVEDEKKDFSKYQEKKSEIVTYSDGTQKEQDKYQTDPVPEGHQNPVEPGDIEIDTSKKQTCFLNISCATILNNMENLTEGKDVLVPSDGVLYAQREVAFYEGESVFDVLLRETRNNRIHMEYSFTPGFNSNYIEGIANLYEKDCGSESGWMYCVNGWYPNYGCSRYVVQAGDVIEWNYTCDLGRDLGQDWMN